MYTTQIDHMNLYQIANSGQCFRWRQIEDNSYIIPAFGKELTISQDGNTFILSCDEDEWNSLWRNYFDLDTDYNEVENIIMESNDDFLKAAYEFGSGIRILRQDLWEVIISFIVSQNNNIPRIKKSIEKLCDETNGKFPEWYDLINMDLSNKGLGYRDEYIKNACYARATTFTDDDLESGYANAKAQLMKIKGLAKRLQIVFCYLVCIISIHFQWILIFVKSSIENTVVNYLIGRLGSMLVYFNSIYFTMK